MFGKMVRAIRLDRSLYMQAEKNPSWNQESLMIVVIVAILNGVIGGAAWAAVNQRFGIEAILMFVVGTVISYFVTSYVIFYIGTNFFGATTSWEETRRVMGYAYAPMVLAGIPCVGFVFVILTVVGMFFALRETLDIEMAQTIIVCIIAAVILFIIFGLLFGMLGIDLQGIGIGV